MGKFPTNEQQSILGGFLFIGDASHWRQQLAGQRTDHGDIAVLQEDGVISLQRSAKVTTAIHHPNCWEPYRHGGWWGVKIEGEVGVGCGG